MSNAIEYHIRDTSTLLIHVCIYMTMCYIDILEIKKIVFVLTITNFIEIPFYQTASSSQNIFVYV